MNLIRAVARVKITVFRDTKVAGAEIVKQNFKL
jgi:hypothetical protein